MMKKITAGILIWGISLSLTGVSLGLVAKKVKAKPIKKVVKKKVEARKAEKTLVLSKEAIAPTPTEPKMQAYRSEMNANFAKMNEKIDKIVVESSGARVGGLIFFRWQKYIQNGTSANNFDIDRAYLDFKKKLEVGTYARVTLDVARLDTSKLDTSKKSQNLFDYLKYAYVEMPVAAASNFYNPLNMNLRLGLQQNMWIDWNEKILNLRFIAKSYLDNEGIMPSSDFGIGIFGKIDVTNMPEVEYAVTLTNGSGYKSPETDSRKNIGLRLNSSIYQNATLGSVIIGGFGNVAGITSTGTDLTSTKQIGALVAYQHLLCTTYLEYLYGTGIMGYSLGGIYNFYPKFNLFTRLDHFDPNRSMADDEIDRLFCGLIYDWNGDIRFALDLQSVTGGSVATISPGLTTSAIYLHTLVLF